MAAVSKIDESVVELRTDVGRLYVSPTFWQRLYLRWTFRNFHSLPHQVLNSRQQRLLEKLWRTAIVSPAEPLIPGDIIGVVENMRVLALPSTGDTAEAKPAAQPAVTDVKLALVQGRAADAEVESGAPPAPVLNQPQPPISEATPASAAGRYTVNSAEEAIEPALFAGVAPRRPSGKYVLWAVGCAAALAVLVLGLQFASLWRTPRLAIAPPAPPAVPAQLKAAMTAAVARAGTAEVGRGSAATTQPAPALLASSSPEEKARRATSTPVPPSALDSTVSNSVQLPQIAEAPRSGFIYPVAPNPNLVGKVMLKAVIGSDGTVKQIEVLSGDRALASAAARAVRQWRYAPAEVQGHAVEAQTQVTISFLGDDAVSIIVPPAQ